MAQIEFEKFRALEEEDHLHALQNACGLLAALLSVETQPIASQAMAELASYLAFMASDRGLIPIGDYHYLSLLSNSISNWTVTSRETTTLLEMETRLETLQESYRH